jgi:ribosomal protein S18 acetylase RimI-like enzyme
MKQKKEAIFRLATGSDLDTVVALMREYLAYGHLKSDTRGAEKAMKNLLANESLGFVWLIEEDKHPVGYFVVTLGYSLEFNGKCAFLDQLHIGAGFRGRGIGKQVLGYVHEFCANQGVRALRVDVDHANIHAQNLYHKLGFKEHTRHVMSKWLDDSR